MKLRLRSLESKQTIKIELPNPSSTLQQLKQTLSQSLSSSSFFSLHFSLNRKDELHASSPEATLQSLGITSGDLTFFTHNPTAFSSQSQTLIPNSSSSSSVQQQPPNPNFLNQNMSEKAKITPLDQETPEHEISDSETNVDMSDLTTANILQEDDGETLGGEIFGSGFGPSGVETMELDDGSSILSHKKYFEHYFLTRVLREELGGGDGSDHKVMVIAIHAVLESGFVRFDFVSSMRVDGFHLSDVWPSKAFCLFVMRKRGSWGGSKHLDHALIVQVKCKLWMLRGSGTSVFCLFASRSKGSIYVLCVPRAWNCITSSSSSSTTFTIKPSLLILFLLHFGAILCFSPPKT